MDFANYDLTFVLILALSSLIGGFVGKKIYDAKEKIASAIHYRLRSTKAFLNACKKYPQNAFNLISEAFRFTATVIMTAASAASLFILSSLQVEYVNDLGMTQETNLLSLTLVIGLLFFAVQCSWVQVAANFVAREFSELQHLSNHIPRKGQDSK